MTRKVPRKIFIYGYYGFGNVGDDLLLTAVLRALDGDNHTRFIVRSLNPVDVGLGLSVDFVPLEQIMVQPGTPRWKRLGNYVIAGWRAMRGCTHFVFGGGTLFHAKAGSSANLLLIALLLLIARLRRAKAYAVGVGVAPIRSVGPRILMRLILWLSKDFAVRDRTSLHNCRSLCASTKVRLTADLVFGLVPAQNRGSVKRKRAVIGLTLAASDLGNLEPDSRFFAILGDAIARLRDAGWKVRLLAFQELHSHGIALSDSAVFEELNSTIGDPVSEIYRVTAKDIGFHIAETDVVVGMRFHGHVIAALLGVPFVGFGRDTKVSDLCNLYSMPFIPMASLNPEGLVEQVRLARDLVPGAEKTRELVKRASENFSLLRTDLS